MTGINWRSALTYRNQLFIEKKKQKKTKKIYILNIYIKNYNNSEDYIKKECLKKKSNSNNKQAKN